MGVLYFRKRFLKAFLLLESFRILRFEVVMGVSIVNTKEIQIRRAKRAGGTFWGVLRAGGFFWDFEVVMGVSIVNTKGIQIRRAKRAGGIFWGDFIGNTKEIQKEIQSRWRWPFWTFVGLLDFVFSWDSVSFCAILCRCRMFPPAPDCQREGPSPICPKTPLSGGWPFWKVCEWPQDPTLDFHRWAWTIPPQALFGPPWRNVDFP